MSAAVSTPADRDPDEVRADFEALTLPLDQFHHRQHVQVAFSQLRASPPLEALARFASNLRRFAEAHGVGHIYNETVSWAFLLLIHERMQRMGGPPSWEAFAAANPDLLRKDCLARFYREETLASPLAKRIFVLPDRLEQSTPAGRGSEALLSRHPLRDG